MFMAIYLLMEGYMNNIKTKAREIFSRAVSNGKVKRKNICEQCGSTTKIEGHHPDYNKPLDVVWLCRECHRHLHKDQFNKKNKIITTVYMTSDQFEELKELSEQIEISQAIIIRRGIDMALSHYKEQYRQIKLFNEPTIRD